MTSWIARSTLLLALVAGVTVACSDDDPAGPDSSPLRGLVQSEGRDSVGNTLPPPPQGELTPGYFHGKVLGTAPPGSGNDSLATMPRIAGVRVVAYPKTGDGPNGPEVGAEAASVTTGSDGSFQLPVLPHGEYVVSFTPPANSEYGGVWVTAIAHGHSHDYPWWVVLWKK